RPVGSGSWDGGASRTVVAMSVPCSRLLVRPKEGHQRGDLVILELQIGHEYAQLPGLGVMQPLGQILVGVLQRARRDVAPAPDMMEVGTDEPRRHGRIQRMATN